MLTPHSLNVYVLENSELVKRQKQHTMKKLKRLFLTLFSVISVSVFSQMQVPIHVMPSYTAVTCNGSCQLWDTLNVTPSSISWASSGTILQQGGFNFGNLCAGNYIVNYIQNGLPVTIPFEVINNNGDPCANFEGVLSINNSMDSISCDGAITVNFTNGHAPYGCDWIYGSSAASLSIGNLCPGNYCGSIYDSYGCGTMICGEIITSSTIGDTLILSNSGTCNNPSGFNSLSIEECAIDYNAIDSIYIGNLVNPSAPFEDFLCEWVIVDSAGIAINYPVIYPGIASSGCMSLQLILYCYQKSMNYKSIIINSNEMIGFVGMDEFNGDKKQLVSVTDLHGRESTMEPNQLLIYTYSDGSKEKIFIHE